VDFPPHLPDWATYLGTVGGVAYLGNEIGRKIIDPLMNRFVWRPRATKQALARYHAATNERDRTMAALQYNWIAHRWPEGYNPPSTIETGKL
jgi:hypothetical protein